MEGITLIDFKKAFDSINRDRMFAILRHHGILERIVTAIKTIYTNSKSMVTINNKYSAPFNITTGILQGDVLAPYLFILVIDYVMCRAEEEVKTGFTTHPQQTRRLHGFKINDLDFADDMALIEELLERAQHQLQVHSNMANEVGLVINIDKTKWMTTVKTNEQLILNGSPIKQVDDFTY